MAHGEKIKKFWAKIKSFFARIDEFLLNHIDLAISITTKIKSALSSPEAILLTDVIPGKLDNVARETVLGALNHAVDELMIVKECESQPALEDKLRCYIFHLKDLPVPLQHAVLHKFGSLITAYLDDNKHEEHLYDTLVQNKYSIGKES